jgi:hypothetical protein
MGSAPKFPAPPAIIAAPSAPPTPQDPSLAKTRVAEKQIALLGEGVPGNIKTSPALRSRTPTARAKKRILGG